MARILVEMIIIGILVLLNGAFALSELALMSARKARLQERANAGDAGARAALALVATPNRFLSTVQIGITLVGVLAGAFGGATLASALAAQFDQVDWLEPYSDVLGLGLVVVSITYLSLLIGELVPKRIALQNPERFAALVARPMHALLLVAAPVVRLLTWSSDISVHLLGIRSSDEPPVTEEEIRIMIEEGTEAGVFQTVEQDMVESVFALDDRNVNALMTPHTDIAWLDVNDPPDTIRSKISQSRHSRFPVCRGRLDNLLGIVHTETLLVRSLSCEPLNLAEQIRPARFVPENAPASTIVDLFKHSEEHIAIVIDEHGGIQGVVTAHDILEAIVGYIPSPGDVNGPDAVQRPDGSWLLDGLIDIDAVKDLFDLDKAMPGEERGSYNTLSGFIMSQLGRIPRTGECFRWRGLRFEVVDMDGYRVDKVLVEPDTNVSDDTAPCDDEAQ